MKLFSSPTSPFARKVLIVCIERGCPVEVENVNPLEAGNTLHLLNPLGKVPALATDEGTTLFDSPVICDYLDHLAGEPCLTPPSGPDRWAVRRAQALADGIMDAAVSMVMETRRPPTEQSAFWLERWTAAIRKSLAEMEATIATGPIDIGQIAYACALGYLDFRLPDLAWRQSHTLLDGWLSDFSKKESFVRTEPPK